LSAEIFTVFTPFFMDLKKSLLRKKSEVVDKVINVKSRLRKLNEDINILKSKK